MAHHQWINLFSSPEQILKVFWWNIYFWSRLPTNGFPDRQLGSGVKGAASGRDRPRPTSLLWPAAQCSDGKVYKSTKECTWMYLPTSSPSSAQRTKLSPTHCTKIVFQWNAPSNGLFNAQHIAQNWAHDICATVRCRTVREVWRLVGNRFSRGNKSIIGARLALGGFHLGWVAEDREDESYRSSPTPMTMWKRHLFLGGKCCSKNMCRIQI